LHSLRTEINYLGVLGSKGSSTGFTSLPAGVITAALVCDIPAQHDFPAEAPCSHFAISLVEHFLDFFLLFFTFSFVVTVELAVAVEADATAVEVACESLVPLATDCDFAAVKANTIAKIRISFFICIDFFVAPKV
jgi:hypothetical protein